MEERLLRRPRAAARCAWAVAIVTAAVMQLPAGAAAQTVVSLTFDDASLDQYTDGRPILAAHGMHGTFFVNSGPLGDGYHMTLSQLRDLATEGHEIGAHTVDHVELNGKTAEEQRHQICDDKAALEGAGFTVTSFAYPYARPDATSKSLVQECGYTSGRNVSGIRSGAVCSMCAFAETIPPEDPYQTRTPEPIRADTDLATIQGYVTQAEQNGGGWVQLLFHNICDGCNANAISPAAFEQFLTWLQARAASGTIVKTVREVIVGDPPPPPLPPGQTPPGTGGGGGPGGTPAVDLTAPVLSSVSLTNRRFRAGGRGLEASARRRTPRGTAFRFAVNEASDVTVTIERALPGRRVGRSCRRPTRRLRRARPCTRYVRVGLLARAARPGRRNTISFSGRARGRALRSGAYRARLVAEDAAQNRSRERRVSFRVVRR